VLTQEVIPASRGIAETLRLRPGAPVIHIDRLRFVGGEPIVLVATYLPQASVPGLIDVDLTRRSLYEYLETAYGIVIVRGKRTLEAAAAGKHEAALLQVKRGAPLIVLDSVGYLEDGTPIETYHALHRGDRSRFEVELLRVSDRPASRVVAARELMRQPVMGTTGG
jgi:GntR family transcriptional regulator